MRSSVSPPPRAGLRAGHPARFVCLSLLLLMAGTAPLHAAASPPPFDPPLESPEVSREEGAGDQELIPEDIDFLRRIRAKLAATGRGSPAEVDRLAAIIRKCRAAIQSAAARTAGSDAPLRGRLEEILLARVARDQGDRRARDSLALYYLFLDRPQEAVRLYLDMGPAAPQDIFHPLLTAYAYLRLGAYADAGRYLDRLAPLMRERRPLRVSPPVLCKSVTAYRLYEPLSNATLRPGASSLLYIELDGVSFRPTGDGGSACSLTFGLEVRDEMQNLLWERPDYGDYTHAFQGPVRDMHATVIFRVPSDLPPGRYSVFVHCRDRYSNQSGTGDASFSVAGAAHSASTDAIGEESEPPYVHPGRPSIEEEKKRLEEEKKRLEEERKRLDEERRQEIDAFLRRHLDATRTPGKEAEEAPPPGW